MKKYTLAVFLMLVSLINIQAQSFKIVGMNTVAGALTGSALGGATMLIADDFDSMRPLSVGFGTGTILGLGIGVYDLTTQAGGYSGIFNNSETSGQLIITDTFYGTLTGSLVGFAISLIADQDLVLGLQKGAGWGAWTGFTFGLVETFVLNRFGGGGSGYSISQQYEVPVNGMMRYDYGSFHAGFISPQTITSLQAGSFQLSPTINVAHVKISL